MGYEKVDWRKPIRLRGGGAVRLYADDGGGIKPVHGAYATEDVWIPCTWTLDGYYHPTSIPHCGLDIINDS